MIAVFVTQRPSPTPSSAPTGSPPADLGSILLGAADTSNIMSVLSMEPTKQRSRCRPHRGRLPTAKVPHRRFVQRRTQVVASGRVCQRILSAVATCGPSITNEGNLIADQMAARVTP